MGIPSFSALVTIPCIFVSLCPTPHSALTVRPESRIIGGEYASEGEFPHQVAVLTRTSGLCGGSVLTPDYILTTAHCVTKFKGNPNDVKILAGKNDITGRWDNPGLFAELIVIHPCFNESNNNASSPSWLFNDIAIIKLDSLLTMGNDVKEIKIDDKDLAQDGVIAQVIGWGLTEGNDPSAKTSNRLKKGKLTLSIPTPVLFQERQSRYTFQEGQIFAFDPVDYICKGDSGGPLLCDGRGNGNNTNVVCGITSFTTTAGCIGPSVFTRVFHYRQWIKDVLNENYNSEEGCIKEHTPATGSPRTFTPTVTTTTATATDTTNTTTIFSQETSNDYDETSRGFPSDHPKYLVCGFFLFLIFLSA